MFALWVAPSGCKSGDPAMSSKVLALLDLHEWGVVSIIDCGGGNNGCGVIWSPRDEGSIDAKRTSGAAVQYYEYVLGSKYIV